MQANCTVLSKEQYEECASGVEDFVQDDGESTFHSHVSSVVPITEDDTNNEH